jgi:hypothetical protein
MGLRPGEKIERIGGPIRVVSTRREILDHLLVEPRYGRRECVLEGFGPRDALIQGKPDKFVAMFCATHRGCTPQSFVTRIEFEFVDGGS